MKRRPFFLLVETEAMCLVETKAFLFFVETKAICLAETKAVFLVETKTVFSVETKAPMFQNFRLIVISYFLYDFIYFLL